MDPTLIIAGIGLYLLSRKKKPPIQADIDIYAEGEQGSQYVITPQPSVYTGPITPMAPLRPQPLPAPAPTPTLPPVLMPPVPVPVVSPGPTPVPSLTTQIIPMTTLTPLAPPSLPTGPTYSPPAGEYEWGSVVRHPQWTSLKFSPNKQIFLMRNSDGRSVDITIPDASYNIIAAGGRGWLIANILPA